VQLKSFGRTLAQVFCLVLCTSTSNVWSQAPAAFLIEGSGRSTCEDFVRDFDAGSEKRDADAHQRSIAQVQWTLGYLSSYNVQNRQRFKARYGIFGGDEERKKLFTEWWIYDVCKANPKATLHHVADEYIRWSLDQEKKRK